MIAPLEPPDSHYLSAAEGWLELGNADEATAELRQIAAAKSGHPAVVEVRWQIEAQAGHWETCLDLAALMIRSNPELAAGWIHRSYALHELQRTREARDQLLPAFERFPEEAVVSYNLACYECRLGNLPSARQWLRRTFSLKNDTTWREAAQRDPDLALLWPEIAGL